MSAEKAPAGNAITTEEAMSTFPKGMPKYVCLANILRNAIFSGNAGAGGIEIADNALMERFKMSRGTVRQAIDVLVREGLVRREAGRKTFITAEAGVADAIMLEAVGWGLEAILENAYARDAVMGMEAVAHENGVPFRIYPVREESLTRSPLMEELGRATRRTGILLLWPYPEEEVAELSRKGIRVVTVNMDYTMYGAGSVVTDTDDGASIVKLVERFTRQGHSRVAFVVAENLSAVKRLSQLVGYREAMAQAGLPWDRDIVVEVEEGAGRTREAVGRLLETEDRPTAIVCGNENILQAAADEARARGMAIPKDISMGGITTVDFSTFYTSMRINQREMGWMAAEMLIELLKNPARKAWKEIHAAVLNEGQSSGPALQTRRSGPEGR